MNITKSESKSKYLFRFKKKWFVAREFAIPFYEKKKPKKIKRQMVKKMNEME